MTNTNDDWKLGETRGPICEKTTVQAGDNIAAGDFVALQPVLGGHDGAVIVKKQNGKNAVFGVALFGAGNGQALQVLTRGFVKVTFGGTIAGDRQLAVRNNKAIELPTSAAAQYSAFNGSNSIGSNVSGAKANNETGVIFLNIGSGPIGGG